MLNRKFIAKTLLVSMSIATLALQGCGTAAPGVLDDPYAQDPYAQDPYNGGGTSDPYNNGGTTTDPYNNGGYNNGGYNNGGTGTGYVAGAELTASVVKVKNGVFLGIGKCTVTVEVMNPGTTPLSGDLNVTFTNGGKPTSHVESKRVTVGPGESQTFEFVDKKWSTDNATAEITTDQPLANTGSAYGNTGSGYGNTGSSYPATGTGASY